MGKRTSRRTTQCGCERPTGYNLNPRLLQPVIRSRTLTDCGINIFRNPQCVPRSQRSFSPCTARRSCVDRALLFQVSFDADSTNTPPSLCTLFSRPWPGGSRHREFMPTSGKIIWLNKSLVPLYTITFRSWRGGWGGEATVLARIVADGHPATPSRPESSRVGSR